MPYSELKLLFCENDIFATMEGHRRVAAELVRDMNGNALLNTPTEDLVSDIFERVRFNIPVIQRDQAYADQKEARVPVRDYFARGYDGVTHVSGTIVELHVPYSGDKDFFFIRPTTFNTDRPRAIGERTQ